MTHSVRVAITDGGDAVPPMTNDHIQEGRRPRRPHISEPATKRRQFKRTATGTLALPTLFHLIVALATLLVTQNITHAQRTDIESWTQIIGNISLNKDWFATLEVQPRLGNNISNLERLFIRPSLGYRINDNLDAALGYAWTPGFVNVSYDEDFRNENRVWQTLTYRHSLWGLNWQHRFRQEQRFIQHSPGTAHRSQYILRASYPFPETPHRGLTSSGQLLVNENSVTRGPQGGFDRTRFFFGPFFVYGPVRYEVGYLAEYAHRFGDDSRAVHALLVSVNLTL